jgi:DNA primase
VAPDPGPPGRGRFFGDDLLDEIRARTDIVAVIGEYVPLKRRGANYVGLCPFHPEKTPSFTVSPDKQMFYCFGCQTGGNVFTFLMKREGLSFTEAVEHLAGRAGVALPEPNLGRGTAAERAAAERRRRERELLYRVMDFAARFYQRALVKSPEGEKARRYLRRRGVRPESLETFRLGYSPPAWDALLKAIKAKGVEEAVLERAGLVRRGRDGCYDLFRDRLMFTICDHRGRPIGFGARALDEGEEPKYLNSPETPLFSKGRALYGLHLAAPAIRRGGRALVVEGYMDVIACHEFGFDYAVASMGTAFTPEQARSLRRLTDTVITAFDTDNAGTQATLKGLEVLSAAGCRVKVAEIPEGKDPDDCLRSGGAGTGAEAADGAEAPEGRAAFARAVEEAVPLVEYRFRLAVRRHDPSTVEGRVGAAAEILPVLAAVESPLERGEYLREFAGRLHVSEEALRAELARRLEAQAGARRRGGVRDSIRRLRDNRETLEVMAAAGSGGSGRLPASVVKAERILLACMMASPRGMSLVLEEMTRAAEWCREIGLLGPAGGEVAAAADGEGEVGAWVLGWFSDPGHRRVAEVLLGLWASRERGSGEWPPDAAGVVDALEGGEGAETVGRVVFEVRALAEEAAVEQAVRDCVGVVKEHRLNSRIEELHRRISELEQQVSELGDEEAGADGAERARLQSILFELIREQIDLERHTDGGTGHWEVPGD